ncbi:MAG TPA: hypothetical protein VH044_04290 [Polyangiaceae bacterium]|jgi:hypothetical protein|nr:hypothetical protein [Polyangiaceae bacterium]
MKNLFGMGLFLLIACGDSNASGILSTSLADGGTVVVGTPCALAEERPSTFDGFSFDEVNIEASPGDPSGAAVCISLHFQGRTTCPYGQDASGKGPSGQPCTTPDGTPVVGAVAPQCTNHRAADSVVWSCRCANPAGQTNDGANYCDCAMGTTCVQAVASVSDNATLAGGYCLPLAQAAQGQVCSAECQPDTAPCD